MPRTQITGLQVEDRSIQRIDLDITSAGQAVITKTIAGNRIELTSSGVDPGTGDVTIAYIDQTSYDVIPFNPAAGIPAHSEGLVFYDQANRALAYYNDVADVMMQIGQELWMRVKNETAGIILDGKACSVVGVVSGVPSVDLAIADDLDSASNTVGLATHDIAIGGFGYVTIIGFVHDIDTSTLPDGSRIYLSDATAGELTLTPPSSPHWVIEMGGVALSDATAGILYTEVRNLGNKGDIVNFYNGAILEDHEVDVVSDGTDVTLTVNEVGGPTGFLSLFFDGEFSKFDVEATVNLSLGSDTAPVLNYVFIPNDTEILTANTSGFPTDQQIVKIATCLVQDATSVQADGCYKVHAWTDHITSQSGGHIAHVNEWIRYQHATWRSGVAASFSGTGGATIGMSVTSGTVLQLHEHPFPAFADPAEFYVVNDPTVPYRKLTNIGDIDTDALGASLRNTGYPLVFWGCISEDGTDCKIFCNLPSGSYNRGAEATIRTDANKYANYSIPGEFRGTGFLFFRLVTDSNGAGSIIRYYTDGGDDLRGTFPNTIAGGATAIGTEFVDSAFRVSNVVDNTKEMALDVSGVATATTRTLVVPDKDGTIALHDDTRRNALIWG